MEEVGGFRKDNTFANRDNDQHQRERGPNQRNWPPFRLLFRGETRGFCYQHGVLSIVFLMPCREPHHSESALYFTCSWTCTRIGSLCTLYIELAFLISMMLGFVIQMLQMYGVVEPRLDALSIYTKHCKSYLAAQCPLKKEKPPLHSKHTRLRTRSRLHSLVLRLRTGTTVRTFCLCLRRSSPTSLSLHLCFSSTHQANSRRGTAPKHAVKPFYLTSLPPY